MDVRNTLLNKMKLVLNCIMNGSLGRGVSILLEGCKSKLSFFFNCQSPVSFAFIPFSSFFSFALKHDIKCLGHMDTASGRYTIIWDGSE